MILEMQAQIAELIQPVLAKAHLELVDLTVKHHQDVYLIEVLADHFDRRITLEECALANKEIAALVDATQSWADRYELVVASPGLDRLLNHEKDFRRLLGKEVKAILTEKIEQKGEYSGTVKKVTPEEFYLAVKGKEVGIPYKKIFKAVQLI